MKKIKLLAYFMILILSLLQPVIFIHAGTGAIGSTESFNYLSGDAKYLGDSYRDNYSLDMEEVDLLDSGYNIINGIANGLFTFCRWLAYLTVTIFYLCFNLNLANIFGSQVSSIQQALNDSIFSPLFLFGCAAAFCILIGRFIKQDLAGAVGQIVKVLVIVILSIMVVEKSDVLLSVCNNITKEISVEMLVGMNSANGMSENINDFAAQSAGVLWENLIHEPWKTLQFDNDASIDDADIQAFLSLESGSEVRNELVSASNLSSFKKEYSFERVGFMILYLIPFLLKCGVYILVSIVQLLFQLLAILFTFMAPLVLIISLVPGYEGLLGGWFRKILESQISILIITLIIGILIKFDKLIFDWSLANGWGWMIALVLQTAMAIGLFLNRDKLLTMLSNVQRGVSNPRYLQNRMRLAGNVYQAAPKVAKEARRTTENIIKRTGGIAQGVRDNVAELNRPLSWTVNPFLMNQRRRNGNEGNDMEQQMNRANVQVTAWEEQPHKRRAFWEAAEDNQQEARPAVSVSTKTGGVEERDGAAAKHESIKEYVDDMARSVNQLAVVIESAEDSFLNQKGDSDHNDARPVLMQDKKESDGKTKENKEVVINLKSPEGKEERKQASESVSLDVVPYKGDAAKDVERPQTAKRTAKKLSEKKSSVVSSGREFDTVEKHGVRNIVAEKREEGRQETRRTDKEKWSVDRPNVESTNKKRQMSVKTIAGGSDINNYKSGTSAMESTLANRHMTAKTDVRVRRTEELNVECPSVNGMERSSNMNKVKSEAGVQKTDEVDRRSEGTTQTFSSASGNADVRQMPHTREKGRSHEKQVKVKGDTRMVSAIARQEVTEGKSKTNEISTVKSSIK